MTTFIPSTQGRLSSRVGTRHLLGAIGLAGLMALPATCLGQAVNLRTAQNFGVLGGSAVTNTGPTSVVGDVGTSPGSSITGFPPGTTTGVFHANDAVAITSQTDLTTAYNAAAAAVCTTVLTGQDLGGLTLIPGTYCFAGSAQLTGNLTLDFQGNPNAEFVFRVATALTTASGSAVRGINNGGVSCTPNVNFQVGSSATLGSGTNFSGNVLALESITLVSGSNLRGRALARNGAVTIASAINVGGCPTALAGAVGGGGAGGGGAGGTTAVPTLGEWSLIFLSLLLMAAGGWYARRLGNKANLAV